MKRIILCLTALLLLFVACEKNCLEKKPKDVKPIDWENYNDVYTAFWNTYSTISESSRIEGKDIMVYGWVLPNYSAHGFTLVTETHGSDKPVRLAGKPHFQVYCGSKEKLDTCDLTQKCYIKGKLAFNRIKAGSCSVAVPEIKIEDIDNFYFD